MLSNELVIALIAASPAYIKILFDYFKVNGKFEKAFRGLVRAQAKKDLTDVMFNALERGYTIKEEVDSVETLYEPYHDLGWNGKLDELHSRYNNLKVKELKEIDNNPNFYWLDNK